MARPIAVGLKYFPFDVDLLDDEALDFLRDKYGMIVNEVYIGLLSYLYKKYGYYIPYETEKDKEDCVWFIYKHIRGGKHSPDIKTVATVIEACVARELFSRELYPKIITSKRAQSTFYSCTAERKSVPICQDIWLLSVSDMEKLSKKHPYFIELTSESKSGEKQDKSNDKPSKSSEKPLNKTKLNITSNEVINISQSAGAREEGFEERFKAFCSKWDIDCGNYYSPLIAELDFEKLDKAFSESPQYLGNKKAAPWAHTLSGLVKKRNEIMLGEYKAKKPQTAEVEEKPIKGEVVIK